MDISSIGAGLPAAYAVTMQKKAIDSETAEGQQMLKLIESSGPQQRQPAPDSTISVMA